MTKRKPKPRVRIMYTLTPNRTEEITGTPTESLLIGEKEFLVIRDSKGYLCVPIDKLCKMRSPTPFKKYAFEEWSSFSEGMYG